MEAAPVVAAPVPAAAAAAKALEKKLLDLKLTPSAPVKKAAAKVAAAPKKKLAGGSGGYVLEDVPHLTDYLPNLPSFPNPLQNHPAYSVVEQYFVNADDTVAKKIVVHKGSARGTHFRRAGAAPPLDEEPHVPLVEGENSLVKTPPLMCNGNGTALCNDAA